MNQDTQAAVPPPALLDRSDIRVKHATGLGGAFAAFVDRIKSGRSESVV